MSGRLRPYLVTERYDAVLTHRVEAASREEAIRLVADRVLAVEHLGEQVLVSEFSAKPESRSDERRA